MDGARLAAAQTEGQVTESVKVERPESDRWALPSMALLSMALLSMALLSMALPWISRLAARAALGNGHVDVALRSAARGSELSWGTSDVRRSPR
jgi:hypothetical protein